MSRLNVGVILSLEANVMRDTDYGQSTKESNEVSQVLSIADLDVVYRSERGDINALSKINLELDEGGFLAVLGPSGCGKSTLLKIISGLMAPSRGEVTVRGSAVTGPRPDVGIVFQRPTLLPWRNVLRNILLPIETLGRDMAAGREHALELLNLVALDEFANHYPHELSGGMQQRVGIARGLIHDPGLLLMDEPFAALDAMTREHMMVEFQRIWLATKKSVVFITHSIPEAVFLADQVVVLSDRPGRVIRNLVIDLPRPRPLSLMEDKRFGQLCGELRSLFQKEENHRSGVVQMRSPRI
jgi:NitT/TauT family transport system ATP-binding protein